ncbi:hypothetical protein BHM03_00018674 [Ensete ventricosum]|uniref:Uncharacterized protein n=1 Tax=Ensete ventricosum TaxID=4639 RepID=A0A445MFB5_ENSVE|nr:hypothetical protein BHM03_00018674 [Ensete ventricosum]
MGDSSPAGDGLREGTREEQRAGKAPYRVIRTGPPTDRYANRPLPGDTTEIDHHLPSISTDISRGREKEEEGEEEEGETCGMPRAYCSVPSTILYRDELGMPVRTDTWLRKAPLAAALLLHGGVKHYYPKGEQKYDSKNLQ